jgi:hypothetical protein
VIASVKIVIVSFPVHGLLASELSLAFRGQLKLHMSSDGCADLAVYVQDAL